MKLVILRLSCAIGLALFLFSPLEVVVGKPAPAQAEAKPGHPKLEYALHELASTYRGGSPDEMRALVQQRAFKLQEDLIRVVIQTQDGRVDEVSARLESVGAREETRHRNLLQVQAPINALADIADFTEVSFVRLPFTARSLPLSIRQDRRNDLSSQLSAAVVSEGAHVISADAWQVAGLRGQGIKVAIIDLGFQGYESLLGSELPQSVATRSFRTDDDIAPFGEDHGTACAEIVHSVAPEAELYFINFETDVEWANAADFAIAEGIDVVSSSIGFLLGPLDGTGFISEKVSQAREAGIFWAQSAGNYAQEHWRGNFVDEDGNGKLEFAPGAELNPFTVPPESPILILLSWDDWPASDQDYDLLLFQLIDGQWELVDFSGNIQSGTQEPFEVIFGISGDAATFGVAIQRAGASRDVRFQLFMIGLEPQFVVPESSLATPADSPGSVTAGATFFLDDELEPFSSQGPTVDGRTKPDVAAPDGVSTATYGPTHFFGTSSSAPHLAGAAAVVKSANPFLSVEEIQGFLEARATHYGPEGKNNLFGSGRLNLGPPGLEPPPELGLAR